MTGTDEHIPKVAALICAKNEEHYIGKSLDSLLRQTLPLFRIVVVDDGSTDKTPIIVQKYKQMHDEIVLIQRKNRGFSALGTPFMAITYNTGFNYLLKYPIDYLLILGADTVLPPRYIELLIEKMELNPKLGLVSGMNPAEPLSPLHVSGSGRIMRGTVFRKMGLLPPIYGWETFEIIFTRSIGFQVKHFPEITFELQRLGGTGHERSYYGWGKAMRELGYHPLYVIGRIVANVIRGDPKRAYFLGRGYFSKPIRLERYYSRSKTLSYTKSYWFRYQKSYLSRLLIKKLKAIF